MKIYRIASILLCCCYLVSSSSLSHAFAMEHMGFHQQPAEESCGCVDHATNTHTKNTDSHDCLERCLGPYKDFSGISQYTLREACSLSYYDLVVYTLDFSEKRIYQFHCLDDPPNLVRFGYAIIGDEVKKLE